MESSPRKANMTDFRDIDWQEPALERSMREIWRNRALVLADVVAVLPDGRVATLGDLRGVARAMQRYVSSADSGVGIDVDAERDAAVMAVCQIDDRDGCRGYTKLLLNEDLSVLCIVPKECDWADLRKAQGDVQLKWP